MHAGRMRSGSAPFYWQNNTHLRLIFRTIVVVVVQVEGNEGAGCRRDTPRCSATSAPRLRQLRLRPNRTASDIGKIGKYGGSWRARDSRRERLRWPARVIPRSPKSLRLMGRQSSDFRV